MQVDKTRTRDPCFSLRRKQRIVLLFLKENTEVDIGCHPYRQILNHKETVGTGDYERDIK